MRAATAVVSLFLLLAVGVAGVIAAGGASRPSPSIEGTYRLISRDLPDGSKQIYPNIMGLITFTEKYPKFNV